MALVVLLGAVASPSAVLAHAAPKAIEEWGAFLPDSQVCLRVISRAVHACFDTVVGLEQRCRDALGRGEACDLEQVEDDVAEATRQVRLQLTSECLLGELTELGYIGFFDAETDLNNACDLQARAAIAALYAPARSGASGPAAATCLAETAAYARKVMRFTLERQTPVMDRIATRLIPPPQKTQSIIRVGQEILAARERWSADLIERCPQFESIYGRTPESLLRTLKQRTECVLSLTYVHTAALCEPPACGNGIPEGTEQCDDGNGNDADACRNDCTGSP